MGLSRLCSFAGGWSAAMALGGWLRAAPVVPAAPRIDGEWWQIASAPDLGALGTPQEQPVDFGIWQARDGTWQLWSCIRNTREPGNRRLFYRWEGRQLTESDWEPRGIAMHADVSRGETAGGLQAPFVITSGDRYLMFYGDWQAIRSQESSDGKTFLRRPGPHFGGPAEDNRRDPMVLRVGDHWICYYSGNPQNRGRVFARTSADLRTFGPEQEVAGPGLAARDLRYAAECPFVVERRPGEFYLFYTQIYGAHAHTTVRYSHSPLDFLADDNVVAELPVAAPEILHPGDDWFIAALRPDLKGIQVARLRWEAAP
jgi:hypothetical protein